MCGRDTTLEDLEFKLYKALRHDDRTKVRSWIDRWREPHRFYHNVDHLIDVLKRIEHADRWRLDVMLAVLFHDIIYWPTRNDNEAKSADFFVKEMSQEFRDIQTEIVNAVRVAIMETRHLEPPSSELGKILCKADLHSLVESDLTELIQYEHKLSKEFQVFPEESYRKGRVDFLMKWLDHNPAIAPLIEYVRERKMKVGLMAGSFDMFTIGHLNILEKAERIFDKVIVARGLNPQKEDWTYALPSCLDYRQKIYIGKKSAGTPDVQLINTFGQKVRAVGNDVYDMDCHPHLANALVEHPDVTLVRGLRGAMDLEAERIQQIYVQRMMKDVPLKTVYITCDREFDHVSSSATKLLLKVDEEEAMKCVPDGYLSIILKHSKSI